MHACTANTFKYTYLNSQSIPLNRWRFHDMTAPFTGADAMVRMLQRNGVKHIFGLCGDTPDVAAVFQS